MGWAHFCKTHSSGALGFFYDWEGSSDDCSILLHEQGKVYPPPVLETRVSCHIKIHEFFSIGGKIQSRQMINKPFPLLQHIMFHLWIKLRIQLYLTLVSSSSLFLARIISSKSFLLRLSSSIKAWCCNNTIPEIIRMPLSAILLNIHGCNHEVQQTCFS